jgi:hypothetical protein
MKKILTILFVTALTLVFTSCGGGDGYGLKELASYDGATLYTTTTPEGTGNIKVIKLVGSFSEMGQQYGHLLKSYLETYYNEIVIDYLIGEKGISYDDFVQNAEASYANAIAETKEFMQGVAETSELTLTQLQLINESMLVAIAGCSAVAAWGDYTGGGPLVVGRNWDMNTGSLDKIKDYMMVTVYNPPTGNSVADINYMGQFQYFQTGMNNKGLWVDMQNGSLSSTLTDDSLKDPNAAIFEFLRNSSTMDELNASFMAGPASASFIMTVADDSVAYSYFWCTQGTYKFTESEDQLGLISTANNFVEYPDDWTINALPADPAAQTYTELRRNNWIALANSSKYKGLLTDETMKSMLELTIENGGGSFPSSGYDAETVYQIVAVPENLRLWIQLPKYFKWQKVDLRELFK